MNYGHRPDRKRTAHSSLHRTSVTSSVLSDSWIICFKVPLQLLVTISLWSNWSLILHSPFSILRLWLCPWPPWQADWIHCSISMQLYLYQFYHIIPHLERANMNAIYCHYYHSPHLRECIQQSVSNWKWLNCWAQLYLMLPVNTSLLFITICSSAFLQS